MRDIFEKAQAFVARWEGGLVDHDNDPGGITNRGVSLRWLRAIGCDIDGDGDIDQDDIRAVTPEVAANLFYTHFWVAPGLSALPPLVGVAIYDGAVNMGAGRAVRQLQAACNTVSRDQLEVDGRIGNQTLRRVRALCTAMCGGQLAVAEGFDKPETFWAQAGDLFRLAKERELVTGKRVPDSMASQDEWEAFHKALGRPDKPEGYTLPERFEAEGVPQELAGAVSELLARDKGEFSALMHKHGLSQRQAEGMFRDIGSILAKSLGESQASAPDPRKVVAELWPEDTEKNLDLARRGARALGVGDALDEAGLSAHPLVLKLAHALGEMTAEDRLRDGGGPTAPMPVGQEAYQEMLRLVGSDAYQKNDPATVRRVEQLAGRVNMK